jgi:hypothetical protein
VFSAEKLKVNFVAAARIETAAAAADCCIVKNYLIKRRTGSGDYWSNTIANKGSAQALVVAFSLFSTFFPLNLPSPFLSRPQRDARERAEEEVKSLMSVKLRKQLKLFN